MSVTPIDADMRARLLRTADSRPIGERLLAYLVLEAGLTVSEAVSIRGFDASDGTVTVVRKDGRREGLKLSLPVAELAGDAVRATGSDTESIVGRSGRPLSIAAARVVLLAIAREAGVSVQSMHQLRAKRIGALV